MLCVNIVKYHLTCDYTIAAELQDLYLAGNGLYVKCNRASSQLLTAGEWALDLAEHTALISDLSCVSLWASPDPADQDIDSLCPVSVQPGISQVVFTYCAAVAAQYVEITWTIAGSASAAALCHH